MAADLVVVCPELSPGNGGVGDYTLRVVEQWREIRPRFLVAGSGTQASNYGVEQFGEREPLAAKLPGGGSILLQYSAYGFHRYGYPRSLLHALVDWKRRTQGVLVVMFHEIWTFWPLLNRNRPLQWLHRHDLAALTRVADAVFTSTASQAEHLRNVSGRSNIEVLPVGSNIRPLAGIRPDKASGVVVLFGLQPSRIATLRKMHEHLRSLAARDVITRLISVGGGNSPEGEANEQEIVRALRLREGAEFRGALPEHEVSELLATASFALSGQDELSVTKSGTFIAYAAHGLNIISPFAALSAPEPLCWTFHPTELQSGITDLEQRRRAETLRAWHDRTCSWPRIAEQFARALHLDLPQPMTAPIRVP